MLCVKVLFSISQIYFVSHGEVEAGNRRDFKLDLYSDSSNILGIRGEPGKADE